MPMISRIRSEHMQARWAEARIARKVKPWCMYGTVEELKADWQKCTNTLCLLVIGPVNARKPVGLCMRHVRQYLDKTRDRAAMWREPDPEPDIKF